MDNSLRIAVLKSLVSRSRPLTQIEHELKEFPFDSEPLVQIDGSIVVEALQEFMTGKLSANYVEDWANLIEGRDDISFEPGHNEAISNAIHELANPVLGGPLDRQKALELINLLRRAA